MTSHEWCCVSTVIAQTTVSFITSTYGLFKTKIWYFIKVAVTPVIVSDNMPASAVEKVVTSASKVLLERKSSTATMQEATPCGQNGRRTLGRPDTEDGKSARSFLISSLMKQVLSSPNKSMLIADSIKNYAQQNTRHVEHCPVSLDESDIHAARNDNLERHEVLKVEDRMRCRKCLRYSRPGETYCGCGRMLKGTIDEVRTQSNKSAVDASCTSLSFMN